MKNIVILGALLGGSGMSLAQNYVGAVYALNKMSISCAANNTCKDKKGGFELRAGAKLAPDYILDAGFVAVDSVEVGLAKFGRAEAYGTKSERYYPGTGSPVTRIIPISNMLSANALYAAAVAHMPLVDDLSVSAKLGLAYVSTTSDYTENGQSVGGKTENHFAPIFGLGLEYAAIENLKVVAGIESTRFKNNSQSGSIRAVTIGAHVSY